MYYHSNDTHSGESETKYMLQASFITALTQFASEMENGDVKFISMERKNYLLGRSNNFILLFTSTDEELTEMMQYEQIIGNACKYLEDQVETYDISLSNDPNAPEFDTIMSEFNAYLSDQQLIQQEQEYNPNNFRKQVNNLVFKSVGYEPGKCNIGRAERLKRLTFGMTFFLISLVGFVAMLYFGLPRIYRLILVIPNFFGFLGFLQYFYRFCTTNAMTQHYDMN